jgi:histidinol dehydrogenase
VGGAQAIGALAYGTASIAAVDVIVGPGNSYVAVAKQEVAGLVGVPSAFTGPSEVVVVADDSVGPELAAIDLIVQAEHGPGGLCWLVTWDQGVLDRVDEQVEALVAVAARRSDIERTLGTAGHAVLCESPEQAMEVVNSIAPEHVELLTRSPEDLVPLVGNAGAVFCGPWSPASIGDYLAGPSHVLPTNGSARFASALTVRDFMKDIHVVSVDETGLAGMADDVVALAEAEGLTAHADSIRMRWRVPGR